MSVAAGSLDESARSSLGALPKRSLGGLIAISIFWFALNFHWAALPLILLPSQVTGLLFREAPAGSQASQAAWVTGHSGLALAVVLAPDAAHLRWALPVACVAGDHQRHRGRPLLGLVGRLAHRSTRAPMAARAFSAG